MIEQDLYGILLDQNFKLSQLVDRLPWLPEILAASEPNPSTNPDTSSFRTLLDTVLVFGGARTSALHPVAYIDVCRNLVNRLNLVLDASREEFRFYGLEIVYRGPAQFFITRTYSPRFDWGLRLTHLQVGRNLDYFAAGHVFNPPWPDRGGLSFIECNTMTVISVEIFLLESLRNLEFYDQLVSFSDRKEKLMNTTMQELGLNYRFKWVLNAPEQRELVKTVMQQPIPPSEEWWEKYCYLINTPGTPETHLNIPFCRYKTHFREHWPLLQFLYLFNSKYVRLEYYDINAYCHFDYWATIKKIFAEVEWVLTNESILNDSVKYFEEIRSRLQPLATAADHYMATAVTHTQPVFHYPMNGGWASKFHRGYINLFYWAWMAVEGAKIWLFQRWKIRKPRVHLGPTLPAGATGLSYWM